MCRTIKDGVPVEPFLAWCAGREAQILRAIDHHQAMGNAPANAAPRTMLVMELGWDIVSGSRRLHRWEHENQSTVVERATVEDALHHAGAIFDEVYPDEALSEPRLRACRLGMGRRMTDAQVVAAHTVYVRGRMTTVSLAELLYQRCGYTSVGACAKALVVAFKGLGLPVRQCAATTRAGAACGRSPCLASDYCPEHGGGEDRPSQRGGRVSGVRQAASTWHPSPEFLERARVLHVELGVSMNRVGQQLLDETPLRSSQWLARRLAMVAAAEGWYRPLHAGRRRIEQGVAA